jgi:hypothetical protein
MQAFRTAPENPQTTLPAARACAVCATPLRARRQEARFCCSGRCRIIACRQRRHGALLEAIRAAEESLVAATQAVAALRAVADLGPHVTATLKVFGGGS